MYPILFRVFGFPIHSYGVMLLIAFFVGVTLAKKRAPRFGLKPQDVYDAAFWALILGVIGARVVFIAQEWPYYSTHPKELYSWEFAGLTSFGGVIFGFFGFYIWARKSHKSFVGILDTMAAPFLVAHAIGRVGCLLNGCCYGDQCTAPWAIPVADISNKTFTVLKTGAISVGDFAQKGATIISHPLFHPAQIYDSLMNLAAFGLLLFLEKRGGLRYGRSISIMLILHGLCRFIYEFWREGTPEEVKVGLATSTYMGNLPITDAQAAALLIILAGVVLYFVLPSLKDRRQRRVLALEA